MIFSSIYFYKMGSSVENVIALVVLDRLNVIA